jgi:gliding motility-associated-like protein
MAYNGCDSLHTLFLTVLDTSLQVQNIEICQGDSVELGGSFYNQTGTYCYTFGAFNGCDSTICINLNVENLILTNSDTTLCFGDTLVWNNQIYTQSGDYFQNFIATNGCDSVHRFSLDFYDEMNIVAFPDDLEIPIGTSEEVQITGGTVFQWSPLQFLSCDDCDNPTITPTSDIQYQILVTDENGCHETITVNVKALNSCSEGDMGIPNAFTPNGDGRNDDFGVIEPYGISNFRMRIYDRWGQKLFETTNPNERWNAQNVKILPQDTYIYVIEGDCFGGDEFYYSGEVLVIR